MADVSDKQVYVRAKRLFETENPGRIFDQGPVIRSAGVLRRSTAAGPGERARYIDRARAALERQDRMGKP